MTGIRSNDAGDGGKGPVTRFQERLDDGFGRINVLPFIVRAATVLFLEYGSVMLDHIA